MLRSGSVEWKVINTRRTRQVAPSEFLPRLKITSSINPPTISLVVRSSSLANLNPDTGCCNFETSRINFNLPCFFHNGLLLLLLLHILNTSRSFAPKHHVFKDRNSTHFIPLSKNEYVRSYHNCAAKKRHPSFCFVNFYSNFTLKESFLYLRWPSNGHFDQRFFAFLSEKPDRRQIT